MRFATSIAIALRLGLGLAPVAAVPVVLVGSPTEAAADAKSDARAHYQAGVKFYSLGDYKSAIREFSAAQQLYPADLNNYNLALCYDKLGDPEPAILYYRAYLEKQPNSDKRTEIDASIARLEAAQARVAAKREAEAKKQEAARKAAEEKRLAEEAKAAEAAAKKAAAEAEAKRLEDEKRRAEEEKAARDRQNDRKIPAGPAAPDPSGGVATGSAGTPGSGAIVSTGDSQLDRVSSIDVNAIRDQRVGGASSGIPDPAAGPAAGGQGGNGVAQSANPPDTRGGQAATPGAPEPNDKPKATPVYKKWWFWVIVGVGAYVLYQVASEPDEGSSVSRTMPLMGPMPGNGAQVGGGGLTLMRW